jgi:hypothetical protein
VIFVLSSDFMVGVRRGGEGEGFRTPFASLYPARRLNVMFDGCMAVLDSGKEGW